ncbi:MAG: hypothetical protein RL111_1599, partial [Pseudomonadota bacterium]
MAPNLPLADMPRPIQARIHIEAMRHNLQRLKA